MNRKKNNSLFVASPASLFNPFKLIIPGANFVHRHLLRLVMVLSFSIPVSETVD
jgi:hypothetical protein